MDNVFVKAKGPRKKPYFKIVSDHTLFEKVDLSVCSLVPYAPDHNLDEDSWFSLSEFSKREYCLSFLKDEFDSKNYDELPKKYFAKIAFIFSLQSGDFYFQKVTPSLYLKKKTIALGDSAEIESGKNRLVINQIPDAVYLTTKDTLIFKSLSIISSIFNGIDTLYKEATEQEVEQFLNEAFISLSDEYKACNVSKPNRKRIALAIDTLNQMDEIDRGNMLTYINDYCSGKLKFDDDSGCFEISGDEELKYLLYGIEERYYTTRFGNEKRLANSIQKL